MTMTLVNNLETVLVLGLGLFLLGGAQLILLMALGARGGTGFRIGGRWAVGGASVVGGE